MNVLLTGATGMIGSLVVKGCLLDGRVRKVVSLTRRPSGHTSDKLVEVVISDFSDLDESASCFDDIDVVFYCLGVYTGTVDRDTFREITDDYPEALAKLLLKRNSNARFCLLSGAGADRKEKSRMAFAMDKGVIENRLSQLGFSEFYAFRPAYIYPVKRREEPNFTYRLTRSLYPVLKLFGDNASITSEQLAQAMLCVGLEGGEKEILENKDIVKIASRLP
ncbi:MAG: NAD(P)H-binding protein [Pseudomonadota bacterium]